MRHDSLRSGIALRGDSDLQKKEERITAHNRQKDTPQISDSILHNEKKMEFLVSSLKSAFQSAEADGVKLDSLKKLGEALQRLRQSGKVDSDVLADLKTVRETVWALFSVYQMKMGDSYIAGMAVNGAKEVTAELLKNVGYIEEIGNSITRMHGVEMISLETAHDLTVELLGVESRLVAEQLKGKARPDEIRAVEAIEQILVDLRSLGEEFGMDRHSF